MPIKTKASSSRKPNSFNFTSSSGAYNDMFLTLSQEIARGRGIEILEALLESDYFQTNRTDYHNLRIEQESLQKAYARLVKALLESDEKGQEFRLLDAEPTILNGLISVLDKSKGAQEAGDNSEVLLKDLLNNYLESHNHVQINDQSKINKLNEFGNKYRKFKEHFLEHQEKVNEANQKLRGDAEYYQIFFKNVTGGRGTGPRQDRLIQVLRSDFELFEKTHPELFEVSLVQSITKKNQNNESYTLKREGRFAQYNLKKDLDPSKVYQQLIHTQNAAGKEIASADLLDRIYTVAKIGEESKAISVRNISNVLFSDTLSQRNSALYDNKLGAGRRLEMLFDEDVRIAIQSGLESGFIQNADQLTEFFISGNYGSTTPLDMFALKRKITKENLYGGAGGDIIYRKPGEQTVGGQLKAKTGKGNPWHGTNISAIIDNETFFFDFADKIRGHVGSLGAGEIAEQAKKIATELGWTSIQKTDNVSQAQVEAAAYTLLDSDENLPAGFKQHMDAIATQYVEDWFLSENSNNNGGEIYTWVEW